MSGINKLKRIWGKPFYMVVFGAAAVLAALAIVATSRGMLFAQSKEALSGAPVSSYSVHSDPKPLPKVAAKSANDNSNSGPATRATGSVPNESVEPIVKNDGDKDNDGNCATAMAQAQKEYTGDVQKEKNSLDKTLSFTVGLNISSQYVADYNKKVTDIFNGYLNSAKENNCVWPVKEPAILPSNYTLKL